MCAENNGDIYSVLVTVVTFYDVILTYVDVVLHRGYTSDICMHLHRGYTSDICMHVDKYAI